VLDRLLELPEQCQVDVWSCKTVAARLLHAAVDNPKKLVDPARLRLLFPSALAVRSNITCKEEEKRKQSLGSSLFFYLISSGFSPSLGSLFSVGCKFGRWFSVGNGAASMGAAGGKRVAASRCARQLRKERPAG
jgi:hypothetical protein